MAVKTDSKSVGVRRRGNISVNIIGVWVGYYCDIILSSSSSKTGVLKFTSSSFHLPVCLTACLGGDGGGAVIPSRVCRRPTGSTARTGAHIFGGPVGGRQTTRDIVYWRVCFSHTNGLRVSRSQSSCDSYRVAVITRVWTKNKNKNINNCSHNSG